MFDLADIKGSEPPGPNRRMRRDKVRKLRLIASAYAEHEARMAQRRKAARRRKK